MVILALAKPLLPGGMNVLPRVIGAAGTLTTADISVMSESSVAGMLDTNA